MFLIRKISLFLVICIIFSFSFTAFANEENAVPQNVDNLGFTDVTKDNPAYNAILTVAERKIITGFSDNAFKPNSMVTRGQFASMMVETLNLPLTQPAVQTYKDVDKNNPAFIYIESAKYYMTGFRNKKGDYFKPNSTLAREDIAVALVKALGYENDAIDESSINTLVDFTSISSKLRKYVALAIENNIMDTYISKDTSAKSFKPKSLITRAEAAVLLCQLINDEKVTDESKEKVTYDNESQNNDTNNDVNNDKINDKNNDKNIEKSDTSKNDTVSTLSGRVDGGKIILNWQPVKRTDGFCYYKVVISKKNSHPVYPADGYLYYYTDINKTSSIVNNIDAYNGGDFGGYLESGETYYFSITAVYGDKKQPGNVISMKYP
jgi:hypothetical protein